MYGREKPFGHENHKPKKTHRNVPSFSSSLLDEICRSIDKNGGDSAENIQAVSGFRVKSSKKDRDEEMSRFSKACLVEKWTEKEENEKLVARRRPSLLPEFEKSLFPDNDLMLFSSASCSSDSSGALSSSDTEFFCSINANSKVSCSVRKPKPVRTGVSPRVNNLRDECFMFDDDQNREKCKVEDDLVKSKSRVLKIYANLKKLKQPISPGARLTSIINSIFPNINRKKLKDVRIKRSQEMYSTDQAAAASPTCSSASSYPKACLSKYSHKPKEKMRSEIQRTVRFDPVGVIVDRDSKPYDRYGRPPLPPNALAELKMSKNRKDRDQRSCDFSICGKIRNEDEDEDEDDASSESSSDLFELDFANDDRFREELPVYETTYFDKNRCLIR